MFKEIIYIFIFLGLFYIIYLKIGEKRKFDKKLTIYKDVGGQSITEVEFRVKEELLPVDPDDLTNCAWFLVTKKVKGRQLIWPRPPYEHWISENHCVIYSKSYKGNNYACLIDKKPFIEKIREFRDKDTKDEFEFVIMNHNNIDEKAKHIKTKNGEGFVTIETATENRCVIFPKAAHEVKPLFDERLLPEMVSLHTAINQIYSYAGWWDKNWQKILVGLVVGMALVSLIMHYRTTTALMEGPIKHDLTVHVEGSEITHEEKSDGTVERPPDTPPPGGKLAEALRNRR